MRNPAKRILLTTVAVLAIGMAPGCTPRREAVSIAGSTTFEPAAAALAEKFMQIRPGTRVSMQVAGSATGIQAARSGAAQIGFADLLAAPKDGDLESREIARDSIAIIVHPSNVVTNLSSEQVRAIFEGTIVNWSQVGGADHSISVAHRESGSGTRTSFTGILSVTRMPDNVLIEESTGAMRQTVAHDPYAIGYMSHGCLSEEVKPLSVDGVAVTPANILEGRYKLVHSIFAVTQGAPTGTTRDFLEFILSPEGQAVIARSGLLPASP